MMTEVPHEDESLIPRNQLSTIAQALLTEVSAKQVLARTPRDNESGWMTALLYVGVAALQVVGAAYMYWCIAQSLTLWDFLEWSRPAWVFATPAYNLSIQIFFSILSSAIFMKLGYQLVDMALNFSKNSTQRFSEAVLNLITQSVTTGLFLYLTIEAVYGFKAMSNDAAEKCSVVDRDKTTFAWLAVGAFGLSMVPGVMKFVVALLHYSVERMMQNIHQTGLLKLTPFLDEFMLKHSRNQYKKMLVKNNIDEKMISLRAFLNANTFPDEMPKTSDRDYTRYQALTNQYYLSNELDTVKNAVAQWQRGKKLSGEDVIASHLSLERIKTNDPYHAYDNTVTLPWSWTLFSLVNISSVVVSSSVIWANLASSGVDATDVALSIAVGAPTVFIASSQFTKSLYIDATATAFTYAAAIFNKKIDRDRRYFRNILIPAAVLSSASIVALAIKNYSNNPMLLAVVLWSTIVNNGAGVGEQLFAAVTWSLCRSAIHQGFDLLLTLASIPMYLPSKFFDLIEWVFVSLGCTPSPMQSLSLEKDAAHLALMQSLGELLEKGISYSTPENADDFLQSIANVARGIPPASQNSHDENGALSAKEHKALSLPTSAQAMANCSAWLMQATWFWLAKSQLGLGFSFKDDSLFYGIAALINIVPQFVANTFENKKHVRATPQLIEASLLVASVGFITSIIAEYGGHFLKHKNLDVGSEAEFDGVFSLSQCLLLSLLAMHCTQFAPPMTPVTNYICSFFEAEKTEMDYALLNGDGIEEGSSLYTGGVLGVSQYSITSIDSAGANGDTPVFM